MATQKTQQHGLHDTRYFWKVKTDLTSMNYRSRCATATGVRTQLSKMGHKVKSVKPYTI